MSDKSNANSKDESMKKYKQLTKLGGMDYFLIIFATVLLIVLYIALYFKIDAICGYILPISYLAAAFGFMIVFIKQVGGMNKKLDDDSAPPDKK